MDGIFADDNPNIWAVVPVKSLGDSKSRLSEVLTQEERAALCLDMLIQVIEALRGATALRGWMVISRDDSVLSVAREHGGYPIMELGDSLNDSLQQAAAEILKLGGEALLVVPGDLPLLTSRDLDSIVSEAVEEPSVVISPSRRWDGTNALLLRPADLINFSFGPKSVEAHLTLAEQAGATVHFYVSEGFGFDVDTEEDLLDLQSVLAADQ